MLWRALVVVLVAVAIVSEPASARAEAAEVEALIAKGNELRRAGTPGPALPYFQKAYELARTPRTTGQLGLAELAAGYPVEAEAHLAAALASPNDPSIVKYRQILADALTMARSQIGELTVHGDPPGADVVINGHSVGALPLPLPIKLAARNTEIVVRAPGHSEQREIMPIAGGQRHELTVNLKSIEKTADAAPTVVVPPPSPPAPAATVPRPIPAPVTPAPTVVEERAGAGSASGSGVRTAAWIVAGGALVAAGAGLGLQIAAHSNLDDFNNSCVNDPMMGIMLNQMPTLTIDECRAHYDAWDSQKRWSIVGYVGAGALAVTSGVLFLISRPTSATGSAVARFQCSPNPAGITCLGVF